MLADRRCVPAARRVNRACAACSNRRLVSGVQKHTVEAFTIALAIIFTVPYLVWRVGRTEYWAPLVLIAGVELDLHSVWRNRRETAITAGLAAPRPDATTGGA